jgi:hypothetical protein
MNMEDDLQEDKRTRDIEMILPSQLLTSALAVVLSLAPPPEVM